VKNGGGKLQPEANDSYLLVFTNPIAGREDEYHRNYDEVHLPEMTSVAGVRWGRRYERLPFEGGGLSQGFHQYLAAYHLGDDPQMTMSTIRNRQEAGGFSPFEGVDRSNTIAAMWSSQSRRQA
jgi:hypothetical protein